MPRPAATRAQNQPAMKDDCGLRLQPIRRGGRRQRTRPRRSDRRASRLLAEESGEHERNDRDAEQEVALAGGAEVLDRFLCSPAGRVVDDELTDPEHETRHRVGHALDELAECQRDCSGGDTGDRAHPQGADCDGCCVLTVSTMPSAPVEGTIWQRRWLS